MEIAVRELAETARNLRVPIHFAISDTKARYRRSALGPLWLTLGTAIGVAGLGFVWSELFKLEKSHVLPPLTIGLVTWQLIAGCLTEAPAVFYRQESLIKNQRIPTFSLSLQLVLRQVVNFAHNSIVILAIVAFYEPAGLLYLPLALLGAVLVALTLWGLAQAVGYLGARYRDIEPLVISFLPILFFLSPVLYTPQQIGARSSIILFNPAAYGSASSGIPCSERFRR